MEITKIDYKYEHSFGNYLQLSVITCKLIFLSSLVNLFVLTYLHKITKRKFLIGNKNLVLCLYMSPVSPVFHIVVTVSIGLKLNQEWELILRLPYWS